MILACLVAVFPFYWMIKSSLSTQSAFQWPPEMIPRSISFDSYSSVVTGYPVVRWFLNSSFVALVTTIFAVLIALNAALALSRYRTRLTGTFGTIILITQMLPATLLVIPMFIIFRNLQLLDSLWGLVVANLAFALPLAIWVLKGFFDSIPREIEEASMIDGSSEVGAFYRVTIPLALPGIIAVSIYAFMVSWGEFFFARTLINQESNWVFTVGSVIVPRRAYAALERTTGRGDHIHSTPLTVLRRSAEAFDLGPHRRRSQRLKEASTGRGGSSIGTFLNTRLQRGYRQLPDVPSCCRCQEEDARRLTNRHL